MKIKNILLASAATAAFAPVAAAADLPMKARSAPVMVPASSWAGWYAGVHVGAAWQQGSNSFGGMEYTPSETSFIGGGQLGHNWQKGNLVYGWEADISGLTGKKTNELFVGDPYGAHRNHISWLSTVRGRLGLAVGDTMAYATAGLAIGGVKNTMGWSSDTPFYSHNKTKVGWAVGGGIEHKWDRHWNIALEGLFVDLGRSTSVKDGNYVFRTSNQAVIARFKLNRNF